MLELNVHALRHRWRNRLIFYCLLTLTLLHTSNAFEVVDNDQKSGTRRPPVFATPGSSATQQPQQILVEERQKLMLRCPLSKEGGNATYVQWMKDGHQLRDESAMFLNIPAVSRIDTGLYRCYAENMEGALYSWPINVTVLYLDGFTIESPSLITVPELGNFVLRPPSLKKALSNVNLSWRWYYQDTEITSNNDYYITLSGALVVGSPIIIAGNYTVQVKSSNGPSFFHHFVVETDGDPRKVDDFRMLYAPESMEFVQGRAIATSDSTLQNTPVFECVPSTTSKNPPKIRWFLNGEPLIAETNGIHMENRGRRLILMNAKQYFNDETHSATVMCKASINSLNEVSATAQLTTIVVPSIDRKFMNGDRVIPVGSALRLKCKAPDSWPRAKTFWFFNGKKIPNSMSTDILKIDSVEEKNYGVYQCEATNLAGSDIASVWVHQPKKRETDSEEGEPEFLAQQQDDDSLPEQQFHFVQALENRSIKPNSDLTLQCLTNDDANVKVTWRKDNVPIIQDSRHQVNGKALMLMNVRKSDAGVYECVVTNMATEKVIKSQAEISIRGSNLIEYGPSNQSVLIGTNIKMLCKVADEVVVKEPSLRPEWSRNGQKIQPDGDPQRRITIDADGSLSITQVGPDSIGTYKCLVVLGQEMESAEASLQIIERPAMPQNVEALVNTTLNPAKIRVSWKPGFDGNSPLINHLVEMRTLSGGPNNDLASEWTTVIENVPPELCCSVLVDNLRPSATAEFRVIAVNRFGQGRPSISSPNITMPQQPPAAAPRDVKGSGRSSSSIIVQWQPPPADQWNGDILGYTVRYRLAGYPTLPWIEKNITLSGSMHHHAAPPGHQLAKNVLIDQLISWRDYEIQVAAFNDLGPGVYSKSIEVAPLESAPMQAPQNVQVEVLNSTDIRVSFDPLDQQMIPGVNLGYKVELWKGAPGSSLYKLVRIFPDYSRLSQQISGLQKFGRYNLTVLCFTAPGDGPRSEAIEFQTEEDVPGPVASINFDQVLSSSVFVQWDKPEEPNGRIIKYILRHWETNQATDKSMIEVSGHETNATIEGLRASTQYSIDLQALTQVGAGPRVEAKFESGIPPELPSRPTSVVVSDVGARSAVVQFIPGFDGHSYIKNWIVEAKIGSSSVFQEIFMLSAPKARSFTVERLRPNTRYQLRLIPENIRGRGAPSEATRPFETRATEPENAPEKLYAEPLSDERIQLVWSPLNGHQWNGDPLGYLVKYRQMKAKRLGNSRQMSAEENEEDKEGNGEEWKELRTSNPKASELTLLSLEPYTTYQIKMYAENTVGKSEASEIVAATTYESAPAEGPPNVRAELEQQSLRVQWDDLPNRQKHGQILGFRVRVEPDEERLRAKWSQTADLVGADVRSAHFTNLRPFTDYRCLVYARTIVGEGPASREVPLIRTSEARPSAPTSVHFSKVTEKSVNLLWSQPSQPNGRITGYEIRYRRVDQPESQAITTAVRHTLTEFSANLLDSNATYLFSIRAETQAGWGPDAEAQIFTSSQRATTTPLPQAPQANPRHAPSARALWLKFSGVERQKNEPLSARSTPIRAIEVEYQRANEGSWTMLDYSIRGDVNEVQLESLLPNQPYRARCRFITDFDRSQWSPESEWIKTLEMEPTEAPRDLQARPYESSSILLEWQALDPLKWNSDRIGYRILYRIYPSNDSFLVDELPMKEDKVEGGKMQHVIKKLASFHHYIVQVQSYNSLGASSASTPPAFVYVGYSIPKQEIRNLKANATSPTTIQLDWDDWLTSEDDVISGYRIRYTPLLSSLADEFKADDAGESLEETVVSERNQVTLTDLRKFTEYQISVCGYNRAGDGQAATIRATTQEDVPGPVGQLMFQDILLDSVNVSWSPPAQPNGQIIGYTVTYRTYRMPEEFRKEIQEKTTTNWLLANRLDEQTTYSFSVQALTSAGAGSEIASNVTIGYNPGAPAAPTKLHVLPEETTFLMRWQEGSVGQSPIKGHLIQAKRVGIVMDKNQTLMLDDGEDEEVPERPSSSKLVTSPIRKRRQLFPSDVYAPRHPIGEWITITHLLGGGQTEYRLSYRQLEPASFYVFRVYARNELGVGLPSAESERLQVPATLPDDPFYTKWWFLVIVGLLILIVIIVFVATLCVTSANAWKKEHEREKKQGAYDTHQLPDDFVVSYELQSSKQNRLVDDTTTPRPGTHTSWLSNENMGRQGTRNEPDPAYGSIGSGLNGAVGTGRSIYGSSSVYQALATDQLPIDGHRNLHSNNGKLTLGSTNTYAGLNSAYASRRQLNSQGGTNGQREVNGRRDYWTHKNDEGDYVTYGDEGRNPNFSSIAQQLENDDQIDADLQAERSFASHYQSTNPLDETYRATWRRTRGEQADRARTPSRHNNIVGYGMTNINGQASYPSRPGSASTNESPGNGSEVGAAAGSASTQSAKSVNFGPSTAGIQLRNSNEFDSPKHVPYQAATHGYSSFV